MATIFTKAQDYITERISHIYIEHEGQINAFQKYNSADCFKHTTLILLALKQNALLIRGYIACGDLQGLPFGWLEFQFKGQEFVFSPMLPDAIPKEDYYSFFEPRVEYKKTRKEILDEFLLEKYAVRYPNNVWQFKNNLVDLCPSNMSNGYLPDTLNSVKIEFIGKSKKISQIVAYSHQ